MVCLGVGCASKSDNEPDVGAFVGGAEREGDTCLPGQTVECSETLDSSAGIATCFRGIRACQDGVFGACLDGRIEKKALLPQAQLGAPWAKKLALSEAVDCTFNPCDPMCQVFLEDPPDISTGPESGSISRVSDGPPPDFSQGAGRATCAHDLCALGAGLDEDCHVCVEKVCDQKSECCASGATAWTQDCVDLVYTECAGQSPEPAISDPALCAFGLFGEERTRFVADGARVSGGGLASGSNGTLEIAGNGVQLASAQAGGDVKIQTGVTVWGEVRSSASVESSGTVLGGISENAQLPNATIPKQPIDCLVAAASATTVGSQQVNPEDNRILLPEDAGTPTLVLAGPGRYGGIRTSNRDLRLVLAEAGTYTFSLLRLESGGSITLVVPPDGSVQVEICGDSDTNHSGGSQLELTGSLSLKEADGGDASPFQVQLYTNAAHSIPLSHAAMGGLSLVAPWARIYTTGSAGAARGLVWAREFDMVTPITWDLSGYTGSSCTSRGPLGGAVCPVSLDLPATPPPRKDGCLWGLDCQVNASCTEVQTAAACQHSKCLEGEALDASCQDADPCVQRICEIDRSCCDRSDGWFCLQGDRCVAAACGDGLIRGLEACDDGDASSGDGCSGACQVERGYVCTGEPSVCRATVCGDGIREGNEDCDDGGLSPWDGCSDICELEPKCPSTGGPCNSVCGDGMTLAGDAEDCDDGNTVSGDGCSSTCQVEQGFTCAPKATETASFLDLPVIYRDFANTGTNRHPDFEAFRGVFPTRGLTQSNLASDGRPQASGICQLPSAVSAPTCPNTGVWDGSGTSSGHMLTSSASFLEWYRPSLKSRGYWETMRLNRVGATYRHAPGNTFYPLTGKPYLGGGDGPFTASIGSPQNFGFTSELRYWFEYQGGEKLSFTGDDDVWVFVGGKLALDLGGLHKSISGSITLSGSNAFEEWTDDAGYHSTTRNLGLIVGRAYEIALFHAERRAWESNFALTLAGFFDKPSICTHVCGDGFVTPREVCDDGQNDGGPGECAPGCQSWDPVGTAGPTWDAHCVQMVKSECDAFCGTVTSNDCGHAACELGRALDPSCSSCAQKLCAFGTGFEYCCDENGGVWDAACVRMASQVCAPEGENACDFAVLSKDRAAIEHFEVKGGLVGADTLVEVKSGPAGTGKTQGILGAGSVSVSAGSTGNIIAGGTIFHTGGTTGSKSPNQEVTRFSITKRNFSCGGTTTTTVWSGNNLVRGRGVYERIHVQNGGTLTLSEPGDYFFRRLYLRDGARLVLPTSGVVNVHVCEEFDFFGAPWPAAPAGPVMRLSSGATPSADDALRFRFFVNGTATTRIANHAYFWGMLFVPHADVYVGSTGHVRGMLHVGGDLITNWGGSIDATGITGAACLKTQVVDGIDAEESRCDVGLITRGSLTLAGARVSGTSVKAGGAVALQELAAPCAAPLSGICTFVPALDQALSAGGAVTGCSYVSGTCSPNLGVAVEIPAAPAFAGNCPALGADVVVPTSGELAPGSYGKVEVAPGGELQLARGTYQIASLHVGDGAVLHLPESGTSKLEVCGEVWIGERVTTVGAEANVAALRLQIDSASSAAAPPPGALQGNAIGIGAGSQIHAILTASQGGVRLDPGAQLVGSIYASSAHLGAGARLDATGTLGSICESNPYLGLCRADDTVTLTTEVTEGGLCRENPDGFTDTSCAQVDLALGLGCDEWVPVCNHGTTDVAAGVEILLYPREGHQFATLSPDPAWAVGKCLTTETVPSGGCIDLACDVNLMAEELTMMVNPSGALGECSLLDNWSVHDPALRCESATPSKKTVTEIYEARCPDSARPVWGYLTWESSIMGNSQIEFSARVEKNSGALAMQAFSPVGRAHGAPDSTETCSYLSTHPDCPVDLFSQVAGADRSPSELVTSPAGERTTVSFLELRAELAADGSDVPTLESYNVTYSCVVDQ